MKPYSIICCLSVVSALLIPPALTADDWPQWRGPERNGMSKETGWNANWPSGGPKPLWEGKVGVGYSSVSVAKGKLYTMGNIENEDHVFCFDAETGKPVWDHKYPCSPKDPNNYHGTRVTPTINDGRAYTLSRNGHFFCLDANSGQVIWSKDFVKEFGAKIPQWGLAGSPLIEKDWVLTEVSGKDGASVAAFDKKTGNLIWKNGSDVAGYASIMAFDLEGERCFVQFAENAVILRKMKDGSELWRAPWKTSYGVNAATPIIEGKEMFLSSGYGFGAARLSMTLKDSKEVWRNKNMKNHVNSCVLLDGYLYGFDESTLRCLDWKTGEIVKVGGEDWGTKAYGKGSLMFADGKLILYGQTGKVGVAEATPKAFKEISSFQAPKGKDTWAPPVLANGRIYVRALETLTAYDVKK